MTTTEHHAAPPDEPVPDGERRRTVDVVVVGGGLAGLTAAATASRAGRSVVVVPGPTPDGRAATDERDGFLLNRGPHALYRGGVGRAVLERLGVRPDGATPPTGGLLVRGDEELPTPTGPWTGLRTRLLGAGDKARLVRVLLRIGRTDPATVADRTVDQWLDEHVTGDVAAVVRAAIRIGSYSVDTDRMSADVAVTQLKAATKGVTYLHGGWHQLADAVRRAGPGIDTVAGRVRSVSRGPDGRVLVALDGQVLEGRAVVVAAGSPAACAALLDHPGWDGLGPAVTASTLDLGLHRPPPTPVVFGVDRPWYLVAHAPAARLAPPGASVVHAMRNHHAGEHPDHDEVRHELWGLARRAGITDADVAVERYLHRMVVVSATPLPSTGGLAGRPSVEASGIPGVFLAGDWVGPEGFLADGALASGEAAGRAATEHAAGRRTGHRAVVA